MAARVDQELGRELGVSATVVQATAAEHLEDGVHVVWTDAPGGQRRKEYTAAGRSLLLSILSTAVEKIAEKSGLLSLPGDGFTLWLKRAEKTPPERAEEKEPSTKPPPAEKPATAPQRPAVHMLPIVRIFPNPIWVLVQTPEKKTAEVRVRHSRLLVVGKPLRCAPTAAGGWECADPLVALNPIWR